MIEGRAPFSLAAALNILKFADSWPPQSRPPTACMFLKSTLTP